MTDEDKFALLFQVGEDHAIEITVWRSIVGMLLARSPETLEALEKFIIPNADALMLPAPLTDEQRARVAARFAEIAQVVRAHESNINMPRYRRIWNGLCANWRRWRDARRGVASARLLRAKPADFTPGQR